MKEESLKNRTIKGVGWSAMDNVAQYLVTFIISIILARILSPDDYGLIGIIAIFTTICSAFIDGGVSSALIRKKNPTEDDYNTIFILNFVMSVLLYIVIYFCSPLISHFFARDELIALTRVSSVSMIISALSIIQQTRLTKLIDFKTQTKITIISVVISGIVGIVFALIGFGVWALVIQNLTNSTFRTILLWWFNHWIPKLLFSITSFKELFGFGWKLMVSQIINDVWKEMYQVVVGKFYSPSALGQYTRAQGFSKLFSRNLTTVIQRVTYPVLSDIQDDKGRLINAYRRIIKTTTFITAISMFALGAVSEPLLYCLIGPKWHEAATYLPLICIAGSSYPLQSINLNMLKVQGRSDLYLVLEIVKKIIGVAPLLVGALVGIMPMLYVNIVTMIVSFFLNSYYSGKLLGYSTWMQIKDVQPSYCIACVLALSIYFLKFLPFTYWVILPLQVFVGAFVFWIICKVTRVEEYEETKILLSPMINRIKNEK